RRWRTPSPMLARPAGRRVAVPAAAARPRRPSTLARSGNGPRRTVTTSRNAAGCRRRSSPGTRRQPEPDRRTGDRDAMVTAVGGEATLMTLALGRYRPHASRSAGYDGPPRRLCLAGG